MKRLVMPALFAITINGDGFGIAYIFAYDGTATVYPKKDAQGQWHVSFPTSHYDRILQILQTSKNLMFSVT